MNRQDVLFGTSSQLALDESPTMVRQIQLAIKESEQDAESLPGLTLPVELRWPKLERAQGKKALWAASARDDQGGMLRHMENVYIPEPDRTQDFPLLMDGTRDEPDAQSAIISLDSPSAVLISSDAPACPLAISPNSQTIRQMDYDISKSLAFDDIDDFEQDAPPSNQNVDSQNSFECIDDFHFLPSAHIEPTSSRKLRPLASAPADGWLQKYRGSSPKSQSPMHGPRTSLTSTLRSYNSRTTAKDKVSHPPSTPPDVKSRFVDIEEILDSEEEAFEALSPTPPRTRRFQDLSSLPLVFSGGSPAKSSVKKYSNSDLMPVDRIPAPYLQWGNIKGQTFERITAHIRSLPPTNDPKKPTWHEKILMYDPIILEDLTSYLNTHTSIRIYKKATQKQIKSWNQMLKANGDAILSVSESGGEVLAIEKDLEAFMVQGWCESMSVCCIWGEGRGKGGVRKGLY